MADLGKTLKDEIRRLARREINAATASERNTIKLLRKTVRALSAQVQALEKSLAALKKVMPQEVTEKVERVQKPRISARSIRAQRKRLGLSIEAYAKLLGASPGSIVNWEQGKTRPAERMRERLVAVRQLGRRDVKRMLAEIAENEASENAKRKRTSKAKRAGAKAATKSAKSAKSRKSAKGAKAKKATKAAKKEAVKAAPSSEAPPAQTAAAS